MRPITLFLPTLNCGGAEGVMVTLANGLAQRGLSVDLLVGQATGMYRDAISASVELVDLGQPRIRATLKPALAYLKRRRPHVVLSTIIHANLWIELLRLCSEPIPHVARLATALGAWLETQGWLTRMSWQFLIRGLLPRCTRILAGTKGMLADIVQICEGQSALPPMDLIPNPVVTPELEQLQRAPIPHAWLADSSSHLPTVVFVGRLAWPKRVDLLLHALALAAGWRLLILGEGSQRPALEQLARDLNVAERVAWVGQVTNPFAYMARAAATVLASDFEGSPNVLVQALACGCPVICSDCPIGPREILADGAFGRLVPVNNAVAFADAIRTTIHERPDRDRLRQHAQHWRADSSIDAYAAVLMKAGASQR